MRNGCEKFISEFEEEIINGLVNRKGNDAVEHDVCYKVTQVRNFHIVRLKIELLSQTGHFCIFHSCSSLKACTGTEKKETPKNIEGTNINPDQMIQMETKKMEVVQNEENQDKSQNE